MFTQTHDTVVADAKAGLGTEHAANTDNAQRALAFQRIFEKVCEQLNFNARERAWFRDLLKDELKN